MLKISFVMYHNLFNLIIEATATDVQRKQQSIKRLFPDFDAKTRGVEDKGGIRLDHQDAETWKFQLHSGTKDDIWYDGYLHFKDVLSTMGELIRDKRLWVADKSKVDLKKLAKAFMDRVDIQLLCSCPSDLYWGNHYIRSLGKYSAKYTKPETRPPRIRNPKQYGMVCKHLDRLMHALPFYGSTCAKWLSDFYSKDIARFEAETKKEYGWVKKVVRALRQKKVGVEEPKAEAEKPGAEEPKAVAAEPEETKESISETIDTWKNRAGFISKDGKIIGGDPLKHINFVRKELKSAYKWTDEDVEKFTGYDLITKYMELSGNIRYKFAERSLDRFTGIAISIGYRPTNSQLNVIKDIVEEYGEEYINHFIYDIWKDGKLHSGEGFRKFLRELSAIGWNSSNS